ncbi:MAG: cyclopropane-fatty-acyl-phospholipid synthase family protein [Planctomycetota bacterium]
MNFVNFSAPLERLSTAQVMSNLAFEAGVHASSARKQLGFSTAGTASRTPALIKRFCRNRLLGRFSDLNGGLIDVHDQHSTTRLGADPENGLRAKITVNDPGFYSRIMFGGTIGAAESFIRGHWETDNLTDVIRIFIRNMREITGLEKTWSRARTTVHYASHLLRKNTIGGSRKNIHEHYDLGNDFYQLFLDPTMNYSSGIFPTDSSSMHEASLAKMDRIAHKLQIKPTDHVLEIGTGWGGLAIHLAGTTGCRVTTTTISREQHDYAKAAVRKAGLEDRITILLNDYRDLRGTYDKIVSIEMIEAVGHQYYDTYFGKCSDLLADDGMMLIQGITISEQNFEHHIRNVDFIRRYIFPGGCLPSISAINRSIGRATDMRTTHLEDITSHYVLTLQRWHDAFHRRIDEVRELGFSSSFIRLWHFYLCYCEAAFAERRVNNVQMIFAKQHSPTDPANEYQGSNNIACDGLTEAGEAVFA